MQVNLQLLRELCTGIKNHALPPPPMQMPEALLYRFKTLYVVPLSHFPPVCFVERFPEFLCGDRYLFCSLAPSGACPFSYMFHRAVSADG